MRTTQAPYAPRGTRSVTRSDYRGHSRPTPTFQATITASEVGAPNFENESRRITRRLLGGTREEF